MEQASGEASALHFGLEALQRFQAVEQLVLSGIDYYIWLDTTSEQPVQRFLWALELRFEAEASLLLSAGETGEAIFLQTPDQLIKTAAALYQLHGKPVIQRISRDQQPPWQALIGHRLEAVRLSRSETGEYLNDAVMLDFGHQSLIVALHRAGEGLIIEVDV